MGSAAAAFTAIAAYITANVATNGRLSSDYRADLEAVTVTQTKFQLRGHPTGRESTRSDVMRVEVEFELVVIHHATVGAEAYINATARPMMASMAAPSYWITAAGASNLHTVTEDPEFELERRGNLIIYTVTFTATINA